MLEVADALDYALKSTGWSLRKSLKQPSYYNNILLKALEKDDHGTYIQAHVQVIKDNMVIIQRSEKHKERWTRLVCFK